MREAVGMTVKVVQWWCTHVGPRTSSSHHIEETEAGLKGLYIREITTVIDLLIRYY